MPTNSKNAKTKDQDIGSTTNQCLASQNESEKEPPKKTKKFRVVIFFDGTGNNKFNTQARLDQDKNYTEHGSDDDSSYQNDFTNVSKLEKYLLVPEIEEGKKFNDFDAHFKIYISGIGTQDNDSDSTMGQGTGRGGTGVKTKVENAIDDIVKNIVGYVSNYAEKEDTIAKIQLDSIGFSRGAAAARYFVYASLKDPKLMLKNKLTKIFPSVGEIKSGFVGLFDTVASIAGNISDDTSWLHLNSISDSEKVLQLAAFDEYRKNFPLTNIKSKGSTEIFLPGVHSDIGGGYTDNASETDLEIFDIDTFWTGKKTQQRLEAERRWLIDEQGWYLENEVSEPNWWNEIYVNRDKIRNTYSRIPLHIMKNNLKDTTINFDTVEIDSNDSLPVKEKDHDDLNKLYAIIGANGSENWKKETELLKKIRHKYFHFSAYYGKKGYSKISKTVGVNAPRLVDGKRKREILNG